MKKTILILVLVLFVLTSAFSAISTGSIVKGIFGVKEKPENKTEKQVKDSYKKMDEAGTTINGLKLKLKEMDISSMSFEEKLDTYNSLKQKSFGASMLNLGLGFGSGSAMVGDAFGLTLGTIMDAAAITVLLTPAVVWGLDIGLTYCFTLGQARQGLFSGSPDIRAAYFYVAIAGGGALILSHIIQAILPPIHVARYNNTLRESLGLTKAEIKMAVLPSKNFGITAVASIQY